MDISPILALFKGKDAENFKAVLQGMKLVNDEIRIQYDGLKKEMSEIRKENAALKDQLINVERMEERCLDQNVKANELIRNLCEWIIFEENRAQIKITLSHILK
jgi:septal ring factor EnvC (AmiA/AmiB activator)